MQTRPFGHTNLEVSVLTLGGGAFSGEGGGYGFGPINQHEVSRLIHLGIDLGINHVDTAPIYGFGLSEERIGVALLGKREQMLITTKGGVGWHDNKRVNMSNDPDLVEQQFLASLKRLQTDYIDFYLLHWPDEKVDIRPPLERLKKYQEKGVIRHLGLGNTHPEDYLKAKAVCDIQAIQSELNYFNSSSLIKMQEHLLQDQVGFMGWGTFDKGILSGRVHEKRLYDKSDARSWAPWWKQQDLKAKKEKVDLLKQKLDLEKVTLTQFCLSYNLSFAGATTLLVGAKSENDLRKLISESANLLDHDRLQKILV